MVVDAVVVAVGVAVVDDAGGGVVDGGEVGAGGADKVAVVVLVLVLVLLCELAGRVLLELTAGGCIRGGGGGQGGGCEEAEEEGVGDELHVGLFFTKYWVLRSDEQVDGTSLWICCGE